MKSSPLPCLLFCLSLSPFASLPAANVQETYWYTSTITSDAGGPLDLLAELNYKDDHSNAPIAVVMHGYSVGNGVDRVRDPAQRLRDNGFFAISVAMRDRDGSDGTRDSGGLEVHDIYDAVEAIKADPKFVGLIDPGNVHITGYSGGGGNTMSALTKFPDYFRLGAAFFGMSDYGFDPVNGWYNKGAGRRTSQLDLDIGNPNSGINTIIDRYHARASNLASKNNPYSEIHLFVNANETICPPINDTSYRDNARAAESFTGEFDNITVHIGGLGAYEDFNGNSINEANESQSWRHGVPNATRQDAGELWYRDRLLAGSIPQPVLNTSDELFVAGYVVTGKFACWLGDGQNAAGELTYSLSDRLKRFELSILSNHLGISGRLTIDTGDMAGRDVRVELNGAPVDRFTGGGTYEYTGLGHGDVLELIEEVSGSTFADWVANPDYGLGPADRDPSDDPDKDGLNNAVENIFGTHPGVFSPGFAVFSFNGNSFTFTHPLSDSPAADLIAVYRWSTNLQDFYDEGSSNAAGTTTANFTRGVPSGGEVVVTVTLGGSVIPDQLFVTLATEVAVP